MEFKKIVVKGVSGEVEKTDLISNSKAYGGVFDLMKRQTSLLQQRRWVNSRLFRSERSETRHAPVGTWKRADKITHDVAFPPP